MAISSLTGSLPSRVRGSANKPSTSETADSISSRSSSDNGTFSASGSSGSAITSGSGVSSAPADSTIGSSALAAIQPVSSGVCPGLQGWPSAERFLSSCFCGMPSTNSTPLSSVPVKPCSSFSISGSGAAASGSSATSGSCSACTSSGCSISGSSTSATASGNEYSRVDSKSATSARNFLLVSLGSFRAAFAICVPQARNLSKTSESPVKRKAFLAALSSFSNRGLIFLRVSSEAAISLSGAAALASVKKSAALAKLSSTCFLASGVSCLGDSGLVLGSLAFGFVVNSIPDFPVPIAIAVVPQGLPSASRIIPPSTATIGTFLPSNHIDIAPPASRCSFTFCATRLAVFFESPPSLSISFLTFTIPLSKGFLGSSISRAQGISSTFSLSFSITSSLRSIVLLPNASLTLARFSGDILSNVSIRLLILSGVGVP